MVSAFYPSSGFTSAASIPELKARWTHLSIDPQHLAHFERLTGLQGHAHRFLLYPLVLGFRLQMGILTHPAFPLPIWKALQIRSQLHLRRPLDPLRRMTIEAQVVDHRILEKGLEIDLRSALRDASEPANPEPLWEALTTYFWRGRFGDAQPASPLAKSPEVAGKVLAQWRMDTGGRLRFGWLTGDYNGIHLGDGYARLFGFPKAFFHPHRVVGSMLSRAQSKSGAAARLDFWLKGPVFYGSEAVLRTAAHSDDGETLLALHPADGKQADRPSVIARVLAV
jgi:hypothetical protein